MNKNIILFLIGLCSGFSLMLSGNTLNYWLSSIDVNIKTIGMFALVSLPYSVNFLWAPIFDKYDIPIISRKFGQNLTWLIIIQFLLTVNIIMISYISPKNNLSLFALIAFLIAFFASSQDCIIGSLKTKLISKNDQGRFAGIYVFGYRVGMLISGSFAIYLSSFQSFANIYKYCAFFIIVIGLVLIYLIKDVSLDYQFDNNMKYNNFISSILLPVGNVKFLILTILFLILYRLPDNFLSMMLNPFLVKLGYNAIEIATAGKFIGFLAVIVGGFFASHIMKRRNIIESLFLFGLIHTISHILLIVQEIYGYNIPILYIVIITENITGGMAMAAYITFITNLCTGEFRATQYSFFTAMMGFSRTIFPSISGYLVENLGWKVFFIFIIFAAFPALYLLKYLKNSMTIKMTNV